MIEGFEEGIGKFARGQLVQQLGLGIKATDGEVTKGGLWKGYKEKGNVFRKLTNEATQGVCGGAGLDATQTKNGREQRMTSRKKIGR